MIRRAELPCDPRFADNAARAAHEPALRPFIEAWISSRTVTSVVEECLAADIPAGPVWTLAEAAGRANAASRHLTAPVEHPVYGRLAMTTQPARLRNAPGEPVRRDPLLGEHNEKILRDKLALCRSLGADVAVDYSEARWIGAVLKATDGRGVMSSSIPSAARLATAA